MPNFPEKIASALMESIMATFRTEAADLERLAEEVDVAGQDVDMIRAAIERHTERRTQRPLFSLSVPSVPYYRPPQQAGRPWDGHQAWRPVATYMQLRPRREWLD